VIELPWLSDREVEVLQHVADGLTNQQIGTKMEISGATVKSHLRRISEKVKVEGRAGLVGYGFRNNYLK